MGSKSTGLLNSQKPHQEALELAMEDEVSIAERFSRAFGSGTGWAGRINFRRAMHCFCRQKCKA